MECELCGCEEDNVEEVRVAEKQPRKLCAACVRLAVDALNKTTGQKLLFEKGFADEV